MYGINAIAKARTSSYLVHSIFYTLQGEGPWAGLPTIFLRLAGCNLQCSFCDTEFTQGAVELSLDALTEALVLECSARNCKRVVITGGEPMLQPLPALISTLLQAGIWTQIETAGTVWPGDFASVIGHTIIVCSPKTKRLNRDIEMIAPQIVFKYIIIHDQLDSADLLPTGIYRRPPHISNPVILVQPCDMGASNVISNAANLQAATKAALRHGYCLSIQIHKIAGMP